MEKSVSLKDGKRIGKLLGVIHKFFYKKKNIK